MRSAPPSRRAPLTRDGGAALFARRRMAPSVSGMTDAGRDVVVEPQTRALTRQYIVRGAFRNGGLKARYAGGVVCLVSESNSDSLRFRFLTECNVHALFYGEMMGKTAIEWTDATWNPVTGCTKISAGCDHCYAERFAERWRGTPGHPYENGFDLTLRPERLEQPLSWRQPRMIFVNSMSDLFHKHVPHEFVDRVFDAMERANWHTFQVLTKRSSLMRGYVNARYKDRPAPDHIWLGTSVEDGSKKSRIKHLRETNASVRFLSIEPLIGPIGAMDLDGIHWVIVGGESGPGYRPMQLEWAREVKEQCQAARVPFFFKQWGGIRPKSGGRILDGRVWDGFPQIAANG